MENPKISIVTPSWNQGRYIEDAIKSVLNQGYENFEHVIVDNCSDDETLDILARYPHLTVISEPDEGQSDAINKGFRNATGDIIGWLNADDYYLPGAFDKILQALSDDKVDAVYGNVKFIDAQGNYTRDLISHKPVKWLILFYTFIQSTTFFFKRHILDTDIKIDKDLNIEMDKDFFANIMFHGYNLKHLNYFIAAFRWHDSNKSLVTEESKKKVMKESLRIFNRYSKIQLGSGDSSARLFETGVTVSKVVRQMMKIIS